MTEVGEIIVEGNEYTDREFILRIAGIPGAVNAECIERARNLLRSGVFRTVSILPRDGTFDSSREDLVIRVGERPTGVLDLGVSYNTEDGIRIAVSLDSGIFLVGKVFRSP